MRTNKSGSQETNRHQIIPFALTSLVVAGGLVGFGAVVIPDYLRATIDFAGTTIPYFGDHYALHTQNLAFSLTNVSIIGSGVGTASIGVTYFVQEQMYQGIETGYASLIIEFGLLGLLLWVLVGALVIKSTWRAAEVLRSTPYYPLAVTALVTQALFLFILFVLGSAIYQDYLVSSHLWFMTGLVLGIASVQEMPLQSKISVSPIANARLGRGKIYA